MRDWLPWIFLEEGQKGRPARPQAIQEPQAYIRRYVEDSCEPRTQPAAFFTLLIYITPSARNL